MMIYIIVSYLVMLGIMIETYKKLKNVPDTAFASFIFSPITLPIIIGMMISDK